MATIRASTLPVTRTTAGRRTLAVLGGAILVALGAQAAVPWPGTPVPFTLQVPAVLIVGGLLGPRLGAMSLVAYLLAGAMGLPVFAPVGAPGVARLLGPTGGYLLASPLAAWAVGSLSERGSVRVMSAGLVLGLLIIHAGGIAQLALLGGDLAIAARLGSIPFLLNDVLKLLFAGLVIGKVGPRIRALL